MDSLTVEAQKEQIAELEQRCVVLEHALRTAVSYAKAGRIDWTAKMQAVLDTSKINNPK